jgi:rRNA maturation endonuclease Nob1
MEIKMEINYGEKCTRCGAEFGIRCIEFQSCYDCNYPYEMEEKVIKKQTESNPDDSGDELPF